MSVSLRKVSLVAWREFLENVRTKAFIIGVIMTPVLMTLIVLAPMLFPDEDRRIAILDGTGRVYPLLKTYFALGAQGKERGRTLVVDDADAVIPPGSVGADERLRAAEERLRARVIRGKGTDGSGLYGVLVVDPSFFTDDLAVADGTALRWHTETVSDQRLPGELKGLLGTLRRPMKTQLLLERELTRRPTAFLEIPLTREVVVASAGATSTRTVPTLHVCDGTGLVLPPVQAALQAGSGLPGGMGALPGPLAALPRMLGLAGSGAGSVGFRFDDWRAPKVAGASTPDRMSLLQLGLDPDALPLEALRKALPGGDDEETDPLPFEEALLRHRARLAAGEVDAVLALKRSFLGRASGPERGDAVLLVREGLPAERLAPLEALLRSVLFTQRFQAELVAANVTPQIAMFNPKRGERYAPKDAIAKTLVPFVFVFLLFYGVFGIAPALLNSVIEEKSNRIIEVLLSSLTPFELMVGKIAGVGMVGFLLVFLWSLGGYATAHYQLGAEILSAAVRGELLVYFAIYFVLGFVLLACVIAAVGAACNTIKDAQNWMGVISIFYVVPMLTILPVSEQPDGALARGLSWIPPITPFVMMNRLAASPSISFAEIAGTLLMLLASIALVAWLASRVFRVGILMYGKPPRLSELWRWIRHA